ncbi:MAG: hypothetical protein WBA93_02470 [Microcoleaceae cyanobacterium]
MEPIQLQILHSSDQEGGIPAIQDAVNFSAVINALEDDTALIAASCIWVVSKSLNCAIANKS